MLPLWSVRILSLLYLDRFLILLPGHSNFRAYFSKVYQIFSARANSQLDCPIKVVIFNKDHLGFEWRMCDVDFYKWNAREGEGLRRLQPPTPFIPSFKYYAVKQKTKLNKITKISGFDKFKPRFNDHDHWC